ncbi:porin family protein [Fulvivirga lutea]|uniref:PorT family protein n=1 Tax=Fulvivirga lutea TaxID=2810512 RepID=A0A974WNV9_9BACT|nr:porin family protein [Fulvivirga lutea]QSE98928.1 PorT family protein [Fulvivirga lutea]
MRNALLVSIFFIYSVSALATGSPEERKPAKTHKKMAQPDVPGTLVIDFGFNILQNNDPEIATELLGSRTINFYYLRDFRIANTKFFILPGIGLGLDRYKFDEDVTPVKGFDADGQETIAFDTIFGGGMKKSMLVTNYIDIPVEVRFYANPSDTKRSFKAGVGFKVGYLFNSHTKIKQDVDGEIYKTKVHNDFNLSKFRYGVTARVGVGGFNVFYYQSLNTLWNTDDGFAGSEVNNATIGISFTGF